jgi:maltose alpha-D-glucosyltransferase/alpha-amylase
MIEDLWYKNAIIYSLDLETFMDANGDGIGDFEGLVRQLDYLHSLGVTVLWLAPFQPTPNKDNGYDISDYYGVDPRHGSSGEFVEFIHEAHKRGIRIIIDMVVNHTSDQHRWFQEAVKSPESFYRDWYVWAKKRPANWKDGVVFPGVQEATWTLHKKAGEYYFHRFYEFQPDLNTNNPHVRNEIKRIMGYWLQMGVAGFRLDAVPFIIETPDKDGGEHEQAFEYLHEMRKFLQWRKGDGILLGEANVLPKETIPYFGDIGQGIHMMFNFYVNQFLFYALASTKVKHLVKALNETKELPATAQWAQFLRNHDELDLGRLSEKQRQEVFAKFAPEKDMQLYERGIRRRLAPMLKNRKQLEMANSLIFSLPGTPVIRYGDELAMGDDLSLPEREAIRTPMQWSDEEQGGFSANKKTVHPVISEGEYGYKKINVAAQRRDPESFLNWTAKIIRLRKECPEIGWGKWEILETGSPHVLAIQYEWRGNCILTIHNFSSDPQAVQVKPIAKNGQTIYHLLDEQQSNSDEKGIHHLHIEGYGYYWYRVGTMAYTLHRQRE